MQEKSKFTSTLIVSGGSLVSFTLGLLAQTLIAYRFGAGQQLDSYWTALVVPNTIVIILISSLNLIFVPVFIEIQEKEGEAHAWKVISVLIILLFILLTFASILLVIYSDQIVNLIAPGYDLIAKKLTANLVKIMAPIVVFSALGSIALSLLQIFGRFLAGVLGSLFGSLVYLVALVVLTPRFGIYGLAIAIVINYGFSLFGQILGLADKIQFLELNLQLKDANFRKLVRLWIILFSTSIIRRFNPVMERYFANQTGVGSVSYLAYGSRFVQMIENFFLLSVSTVLFPSLARDIANGNPGRVKETMRMAIRMNAFIVFPILAGLAVSSRLIVGLLLERGAFSYQDTRNVSLVVIVASGSLLSTMVGSVTSKILYALKSVWYLAFLSLESFVAYILLARLLMPEFGYLGIALAGSINLNWPFHIPYIRYRLGSLGLFSLARDISRFVLISAIMGVMLFGMQIGLFQIGVTSKAILLLSTIVSGFVFYLGCSSILDFPEFRILKSSIWNQIIRVRSRYSMGF